LRDALAGLFQRDALAAIQRGKAFLHGLAEFQFMDGVRKRGIRRRFFRHFQENFFGTHAANLLNSCLIAGGFREKSAPRKNRVDPAPADLNSAAVRLINL
jgi:hypothetical protein